MQLTRIVKTHFLWVFLYFEELICFRTLVLKWKLYFWLKHENNYKLCRFNCHWLFFFQLLLLFLLKADNKPAFVYKKSWYSLCQNFRELNTIWNDHHTKQLSYNNENNSNSNNNNNNNNINNNNNDNNNNKTLVSSQCKLSLPPPTPGKGGALALMTWKKDKMPLL